MLRSQPDMMMRRSLRGRGLRWEVGWSHSVILTEERWLSLHYSYYKKGTIFQNLLSDRITPLLVALFRSPTKIHRKNIVVVTCDSRVLRR